MRRVSGPSKEHGLKEGEYVTYCVLDGKSYRGEVRHVEASEPTFFSLIPLSQLQFKEDKEKMVSEIELVPSGKWSYNEKDDLKFDSKDFDEMVNNFTVRSHGEEGIPITVGHPKFDEEGRREELPAVGWIKKIFKDVNESGKSVLKGLVEWAEEGAKLIKDESFKYISPEIDFGHRDPQTDENIGTVLLTAALTNFPFFKELATIKLSETVTGYFDEIKPKGGEPNMAKTKEELIEALAENPELEPEGEEETKLLEEIKAEQAEETEEEEVETEPEEEGKVEATETIKASEIKSLRESAKLGKEAHKKLVAMETAKRISDMTFSESNKDGKLIASQAEKVQEFALSLNEGQRNQFFSVLETFKSLGSLFEEIGKGGEFSEEEQAPAGVDAESYKTDKEIKKLMSENDISYTEAMNLYIEQNPKR